MINIIISILFIFYFQVYSQIKVNNSTKRASNCTYRVINDQFLNNIFGIDIFRADSAKIKNLFKPKAKLSITNENGSEGSRVTYYVYKSLNSFIKVQLNDGGNYIDKASIVDSVIELKSQITIGMFKNVFLKKLGQINIVCDTINVTDEDQTEDYYFIFRDNLLKEVKIEPFY